MTQELAVGDVLKSNTKRDNGAQCVVTKVGSKWVEVADGYGKKHSFLRKRIYTDGKPRTEGFTRQGDDTV